MRRNLVKYLTKHPECEEYRGQDKDPNLQAGAIDPVTGERIAVQNEHVPIWHRIEHRKVTGNAAPLRKNLETYLKKNPNCEVYDGQDKRAKALQNWSSSQGHPNATSVNATVPRGQNAANQLHNGEAVSAAPHQMHHHTHQPVRRWIYTPGKHAWGPPGGPQGQQQHPAQNPSTTQQVPSLNLGELSYSEIVSSWSNNPEWVNHGVNAMTPLTPTAMNGLHGLLPASFGSHPPCMSPMDTGDSNINGIPIPGGIARDRPDVCMGASFGTGTTPLDYPGLLGTTPRSIDADPDAMQFSPSNYLLGSLPSRSPPQIRMSQPALNPPALPTFKK